MPSLLLTFVFLQVFIELINTIGASTIDESLWIVAMRLHPTLSLQRRTQNRLRGDVVKLKRELAAVSAQDNFAGWAKLRREHDRVLGRHDEIVSQSAARKSRFISYAASIRWLSTNGLRLFLQFWYARTAVFRLPVSGLSSDAIVVGDGGARVKGWAPYVVEWVVGFPRVKERGGVSVQIWGWVCVVVVGLLAEGLVALTGRLGFGEKVRKEGGGKDMSEKMGGTNRVI